MATTDGLGGETADADRSASLDASVFAALIASSPDGVIVLGNDQRVRYANTAALVLSGGNLAVGAPLVGGLPRGSWRGVPWPHPIEGREVEAAATSVMVDGETLIVVSLRDVTENRRRAREAAAIARIAASLTFDQAIERTLDALAASVVDVTQAVACAVTLIDEARELFQLVGTFGLPAGYAAAVEASWRAGANLASVEAYRTGRPVVRSVRGYVLHDQRQAAVHALLRDVAWDAIVSVPLIYHDRALGAMSCSYPAGMQPNEEEIAFLLVIANQAAVAVETARLFAQAHGKAALEERQRLARELHDSVSQALYGIALGARTARTLLDRDPAKVSEPLDYVLQLAEAGMAEMRALIFELRPESLEQEGLVVAIGKQTAAARARHGIAVETAFGDEPEAPIAVKEALYRIAQEALHNTVKHARATRVEIRLAVEEGDRVALEIADNGRGFDAGESFPGHLGLRSMRERVERVGGSFGISSAPGEGTTVRAVAPIGGRA